MHTQHALTDAPTLSGPPAPPPAPRWTLARRTRVGFGVDLSLCTAPDRLAAADCAAGRPGKASLAAVVAASGESPPARALATLRARLADAHAAAQATAADAAGGRAARTAALA